METRLDPCRSQPVTLPLPFKIIHTNCVLFLVVAQVHFGFKTSTMLVYMILYGKGVLTGLLHIGTVLFPFFFNRSIQCSSLFLIKTFLLLFQMLLGCLVVSVYHSLAVEEKRRTTSSVS